MKKKNASDLMRAVERLVQKRRSRPVRLLQHGGGKVQIVMETSPGNGEAISPIGTPSELSFWLDGLQTAMEFEQLFHNVKMR